MKIVEGRKKKCAEMERRCRKIRDYVRRLKLKLNVSW
jgi:hypothetical protein